MDNLWILTEERPKKSVIRKILEIYCDDFGEALVENGDMVIKPLIQNMKFGFRYTVQGVSVGNAENIYIKTVSGYSSFLDFIVFKQDHEPRENDNSEIPIMGIEETKTSDLESRNTGVSQRVSKFVYFKHFYPDTKIYMLYNDELENREDKKPSKTSIFGTNIIMSLGVTIIGKETDRWFSPFGSIEDIISFKAGMRKPPEGNVPIEIIRDGDVISVSGRLDNPAGKGNIGYDPNMGTLSMIGAGIRHFGWRGRIVITHHRVSQDYVTRNKKNKFLFNCELLGMELDGLTLPTIQLPEYYWHYERSSEKAADILLHIQAIEHGLYTVYENHAGCERGYFRDKEGHQITLPKRDKNDEKLRLPDVVLYDETTQYVLLVEGKKLSTISQGLSEIQNYDSIENDYIKKYYPNTTVLRCLSIFGGDLQYIPHEKVLFYLNNSGDIIINTSAPECIKQCF